ncbi:hypothetical protein [Acetobacterium wieringae]|uniref:hypothetical protein n=1 Tax=Acetobacterium wieringae TaxID=52694 RepID=UPI002B200B55|nr:hypothetical protein [Acetobacterium wieringae]MEA4805105.1 hypothetical protein [Acetobacterium wieringae]
MNYMPEVLKMLGVEVGEEFKVRNFTYNPYHFNKYYRLVNSNSCKASDTCLTELLTGEEVIEKLPWKPKAHDGYFSIDAKGNIETRYFIEESANFYHRYNAGNCFRTAEEITPEIKERILREMKGPYANDKI